MNIRNINIILAIIGMLSFLPLIIAKSVMIDVYCQNYIMQKFKTTPAIPATCVLSGDIDDYPDDANVENMLCTVTWREEYMCPTQSVASPGKTVHTDMDYHKEFSALITCDLCDEYCDRAEANAVDVAHCITRSENCCAQVARTVTGIF
jgi:hypothetical protein